MARPISLRLSQDILDTIDKHRGDLSRTDWIRAAIVHRGLGLDTPLLPPPTVHLASGEERPLGGKRWSGPIPKGGK